MAITITGLGTVVVSFVVLAIVLGIGGTIMAEVEDTQCDYTYDEASGTCNQCANVTAPTYNLSSNNCENQTAGSTSSDTPTNQMTTAFNASLGGTEGIGVFGEWLPTIAVIFAAAAVIGIIGGYFYLRS